MASVAHEVGGSANEYGAYVPRDQLTPWLQHVPAWNPVTYMLQGFRSLAMTGWNAHDLATAALAIGIIAVLSMAMCFKALDGRVKQKRTAGHVGRRVSTHEVARLGSSR